MKVKRNLYLAFAILNVNIALSQVTIGSGIVPTKGSLVDLKEQTPNESNITANKGLLLPRLILEDYNSLSPIIINATEKEKKDLVGLQVYHLGNDVIDSGLKVWNGEYWDDIKALNGLSKVNNEIELGGELTRPTKLNSKVEGNNLEFNSEVNGSNFLITNKAKLGINTDAPQQSLDVNGTFRLGTISENRPKKMDSQSTNLVVDNTTGQVTYAPKGFPYVVGGERPPAETVLSTFNNRNTIVRVRFIIHPHKSNEFNNSTKEGYLYGDFTIVGMGEQDPIKFIDVNIKRYDGEPRVLTTKSDTEISWNDGTLGSSSLKLNQETGELTFKKASIPISYIFEFLGGL